MPALQDADPAISAIIDDERARQEDHLELIASENYASRAVLEAQGSVLTNKYAEGYPGRRYYGGCEHVDRVEDIAIDRAKALFGADYANVQPHSGSQANAAVYLALLTPGDAVLGMNLQEGGHLTHGASVNFSGRMYRFASYGVDPNSGLIAYDALAKLANEIRPRMIVAGFSAYSRTADWAKFAEIAKDVDALLMVDMAHVSGLIAAGVYPNPVPHADVVTTTTHKTLAGPRGGLVLARHNPNITKKIDSALFPGSQGGPLMHAIAAKAVCFLEAMSDAFKARQQQTIDNARAMASVFHERGYKIVSGGTDSHLFLVDLSDKDITGKAADAALERARITVNKNTVPGEQRSPFVTSGLRIGTPAMTRRGMGTSEARLIASWMCDVLEDLGNDNMCASVAAKVTGLCRTFPVYDGAHAATDLQACAA
ncbi:MAG: serine hydroxymethyltransferase [Gammaproteobacteria bacterium]|nr:serine hydroxymethyltransferase [Gammaproteobacteria bacterium]MCY4199206.1 serine hydroxymethyltransferase [Gammaproteobacteria bacterium]MCY4278999.1 serine hydroxymethyltransferase [Gammaproteobacteria bacterium]MCY4323473.1 serine hydroxymethyltransferase [Gammaproteobacteria bacterium]